ncbi:Putative Protocatechuate 3,4-dioxygenase beta subunit [Penicillium brasilianum]|uniref:Putative Protocatechuate 3,4-dioxygenase beta subunit n=1 Tax=Penicillium brasilianum TaxID=104259 RepID=A0A0F7TTC1_PENBI|nr:Putative Protocatechuate 3,4-dioxygenase beta subunit [Penicillium brasilianum]
MVRICYALIVGLAGLLSFVSAHPGDTVKTEAATRAAYLRNIPVRLRSLTHCTEEFRKRGIDDTNFARREAAVRQLRKQRGLDTGAGYLKARDFNSVLETDHRSNLKNVKPSTDPRILFSSGGTCIVQPEVTQGPYYIAGELIRRNVAEDQAGVPLFLDIQLIDTNTCDPLPGIYTDIWHCNSTGVYSGVVASGNGNGNDTANLQTTFLRGVQPSGHDGVVGFETIFPGHYTGRTTHIHVVTHPANETQIFPNGTLSGMYDGKSSHVGQIFFDQDLITEVEKCHPYADNTQDLLKNSEDSILEAEAGNTDPVMEYVYLGKYASDGIFAWISIGINAKRDDDLSPEGYWTEDGGEVNDNFSMDMAGLGSIGSMSATSIIASATDSS